MGYGVRLSGRKEINRGFGRFIIGEFYFFFGLCQDYWRYFNERLGSLRNLDAVRYITVVLSSAIIFSLALE